MTQTMSTTTAHYAMYIGGQWVEPLSAKGSIDVIDSATEDFEGAYALDRGTGWRRGDELEANDYFLVEELWHPSPQTPTQTLMNGPNATSRGRSGRATSATTRTRCGATGSSPASTRPST